MEAVCLKILIKVPSSPKENMSEDYDSAAKVKLARDRGRLDQCIHLRDRSLEELNHYGHIAALK